LHISACIEPWVMRKSTKHQRIKYP
jgi:hypothetical protein